MTDPKRDSGDIAKAAAELSANVATLSDRLTVSERQNRRTRYAVIASSVVAILAVLGIVITAILALRVQDEADKLAQTQQNNCRTGNEVRAANISTWQYLIDLTASPDSTAEQRELVDDFMTYVTELNAPRDCTNFPLPVRTLPPPPTNEGGE